LLSNNPVLHKSFSTRLLFYSHRDKGGWIYCLFRLDTIAPDDSLVQILPSGRY
jgi:hypothetical protein